MGNYSVYRRSDSPYWWISYDVPKELRRTAESSGQRRDDPLGYKRALDLAREKAEDADAAYSERAVAAWHTWVPGWLELKYGTKARTFAAEKHRWRWIHAFLVERKIVAPSSVTYQAGLDFLTWRQKHTTRSGKGSYNNALGELKMLGRVMREAVRRGFVTASPLERMGLKRQKPPKKRAMTREEIANIRAALKVREGALPVTERWMTVSFEIAIKQGCRLAETSIPMADINEERGTITRTQKGDRVITRPLHPDLRPLVAELRAAGAPRTCILPGKLAGKYWHWFLKGRPERNQPAVAPGVCFHCTRVTVITEFAIRGVPIQQAMAYVGHADATVHQIYQDLHAPHLESCTKALDF